MAIRHNLPSEEEVYGSGIGPIPHYPNWAYHCPECNRLWEMDIKFSENFIAVCSDCIRKEHKNGYSY